MLTDISRFEGEQASFKILKSVWVVITDYLVIFLAALSVIFAGMDVSSGSFECLPAVDCPSISKPTTKISMVTHAIYRNACEAFYDSQNGNITKRTVVVTDIKNSLQYVKFVNSECSRSAIPNFLAYFPFWLFLQAFILIITGNLWLKLPISASVIERFVALVMDCHASPWPNLALTQALSDMRAPSEQDRANTEMINSVSDRWQSSEFHTFDDPTTISAIKALYEKVKKLKENIQTSHKFIKIWIIYLLQSLFQCTCAVAFFVINIWFIHDLKETMNCTITQHIPVPHDYFICAHNLAPVFAFGLKILYLPTLGISILTFLYISSWTISIVLKNRCTYQFETESLEGSLLSDINPVNDDLGFLLHLLHSYDKSFVDRFAHFLSKKNKKKIMAFLLNREFPVEELQKLLRENRNKLTFKNLPGIPETIFKLATEIVTLEFIDCLQLENEDFDDFFMLNGVRKLAIVRCGLKSIPLGVLKMEQLEELILAGNVIESVDESITNLKNLETLDLSDNKLKKIPDSLYIPWNLFALKLSGNSELEMQALKSALACERLNILELPNHLARRRNKLNQFEQTKFDKAVKHWSKKYYVVPYTPAKAPHIDQTSDRIYKMNSYPKGIAVIFNIASYPEHSLYSTRRGSEKDVAMLKSLFEDIGFDTLIHIDIIAEQAKEFLNECAINTDYKECDCIAVVVMAHGCEDGLIFSDEKVVPVMDLVDIVVNSPLYQDKPKLFFIQACRGIRRFQVNNYVAKDDGCERISVRNDNDDNLSSYQGKNVKHSIFLVTDKWPGLLPEENETDVATESSQHVMIEAPTPKGADVLLSFSSLQGYPSFRDIVDGSWYVNALVETFAKHAWEEDILSLLTLVNYAVVRVVTSTGWRQVPAPQSTLRKKLYLLPGYPSQRKPWSHQLVHVTA